MAAFPIAFLCSILGNIAARSVGHMTGVILDSKVRINEEDDSARNCLVAEAVEVHCQTLCLAGTYGLDITCETTQTSPTDETPSLYHCSLKIVSNDEAKIDIGIYKVTFSLQMG